ncbi:MAG TPA: hypothetical protein VGK67_05350 [Myxococcales bacterium]
MRSLLLLLPTLFAACSIGGREPADGSLSPVLDGAVCDAASPSLDSGGPSAPDAGNEPREDAGARPGRDASAAYDAGSLAEVIAAMPANSWRQLPNTPMSAVCPKTLNHYVCDAVTNAWSGGAFDPDGDQLFILGGGHADSFVNCLFGFDLATGHWTRWTELPAGLDHLPDDGSAVPPVFVDVRAETCGLYPKVATLQVPAEWLTASGYLQPARCDEPSIAAQLDDQQPRSAHTYGNLAFAEGRLFILGAIGLYQSGQCSSPRVMGYDLAARRWIRAGDNTAISYGTSAVDGRGHVLYIGNRTVSDLDPVAGTWKPLPNAGDADGYYAAAAVDTQRNKLVLTKDGKTLQTWSLADGAHQAVDTALATALPEAVGFEYVADRDRFFAWLGGTELAVLDADTLTWTTVDGGGDDPGPRKGSGGTYGRFRYSPKQKVFVLVNDANQDVYLYKP